LQPLEFEIQIKIAVAAPAVTILWDLPHMGAIIYVHMWKYFILWKT